jgi:spore coat protein U-like protein
MRGVTAMRRFFVIAAFMVLAPQAAKAVTCTGSFGTLALGTYTGALSTTGTDSATVNCPAGFKYAAGLNAGTGAGATTINRKMTGPSSATLGYQLFQDTARTINWGNNNGVDTVAGTGTGANQTVSVYPRIPAGEYVAPGSYTDTVTITLYNTSPLETASISVTATVQAACTISATALNFGVYSGAQTDATSIVTVKCTNTTPYYVNLDDGLNSSNYYPRMIGPASKVISYRLYQNAARTTEWRNTYNVDGEAGTGNGLAQQLTVYGRITAAQYVTPGAYSDTIVATVTY